MGRPPDAAAGGGLHAAAARRRAVHQRAAGRATSIRTSATPSSAASSPTSRSSNYADTITSTLLQPLGMTSSGFDVEKAPPERRALGYRWEDDAWRIEADTRARRLRRDGRTADERTRLREVGGVPAVGVAGAQRRGCRSREALDRARTRAGLELSRAAQSQRQSGTPPCRQPATYGMGMNAAMDCDLGFTLSHSGGYPGLRFARDAAAGSRRRHLRVRQSHLRRSVGRGLGRSRRARQGGAAGTGARVAGQRRPGAGVSHARRDVRGGQSLAAGASSSR